MNPQKPRAAPFQLRSENMRQAIESALLACPQHKIDWLKVNLKASSAAQQVNRIASLFPTSR
jgi:hypothetical protein